ncbi:BRI3-binding protein [Suricata suricatta]|nr:BRI3-binding protein [Suricata suricatta]
MSFTVSRRWNSSQSASASPRARTRSTGGVCGTLSAVERNTRLIPRTTREVLSGVKKARSGKSGVGQSTEGDERLPRSGFLTRLTERFVLGVDMFIETLWKVWTDLLDVLGLDVSNLHQYFSPASVASSPARALLLVGVVLLAYWFLSLSLGVTFSLLHAVFGRFFWIARVVLFSLSCVYVLHKYEGEPENAVLPLCFVVAVYFMTGPMGFYWRSGPSGPSLEEKLEHLESQVRLLNIRLNKVLESLDRANGK